jgi:hypothetical protein
MASQVTGGPPQRNHSSQQVILHDEVPQLIPNSREHHFFAGTDFYLALADKVLKPKHKHANEANPR